MEDIPGIIQTACFAALLPVILTLTYTYSGGEDKRDPLKPIRTNAMRGYRRHSRGIIILTGFIHWQSICRVELEQLEPLWRRIIKGAVMGNPIIYSGKF